MSQVCQLSLDSRGLMSSCYEIEEESRETLRRSFAMEKVSFRSHKIGLGKPILSVTVVGRGLASSM